MVALTCPPTWKKSSTRRSARRTPSSTSRTLCRYSSEYGRKACPLLSQPSRCRKITVRSRRSCRSSSAPLASPAHASFASRGGPPSPPGAFRPSNACDCTVASRRACLEGRGRCAGSAWRPEEGSAWWGKGVGWAGGGLARCRRASRWSKLHTSSLARSSEAKSCKSAS
eukprot:1195906-Prorocentrum_minimum.AAC.2